MVTPAAEVMAVVPARYDSSRLPGKLMAPLAGRPVVAHVLEAAGKAQRVGEVLLAADHPELVAVARDMGVAAVLTGPHESGSDRVGEAISGLGAEIILNLQGDEPCLPPVAIDRLVELLDQHPQAQVSTLATAIDPDEPGYVDPNVVKVVLDDRGRALYFSRAPIPARHPSSADGDVPVHRHVGAYGFRRPALDRFLSMPPSSLERAEGLEQLRLLEAGMPVAVGLVDAFPAGVDTAADLERLQRVLGES